MQRLKTLAYALVGLLLASIAVVVVRFLARPVPLGALAIAALLAIVVLQVARRDIPGNTVLELDLERGVVERIPVDPIGRALASGAVTLRDVTDALDRAAGDKRVIGLVSRLGNGSIGVAQAQELRAAIGRFSGSGKVTVAYAETFGEGRQAMVAYYLATGFDQIHLQPSGELNATGVITRSPFLRGVFEKLGITTDFDHRREYKAALYLLTEDHYTEPHREATLAVMDAQLDEMVAGIAEARSLEQDQVRSLIDRAPLLPSEALEAGLVDSLSYRDQAIEQAKGEHGRLLYLHQYLKRAGRPHRRGAAVALIYGVGSIGRGKPQFDPLTRSSSMGADSIAEAFRRAIESKAVKAILFRVDSPGGSAVGSETIRRETVRAREAGKPVVVSMGNVAGSGGYWISSAADRIVAQPSTITGSIGVVAGKLVTRDAWRRIGVSWDELHRGEHATFASSDRPYTRSERTRFESYLDSVYDEFKARVAESRRLDPEAVENAAKGRIWSGKDALALGLIDELGGLDRALAIAKELAQIADDRPVKLVVYPKERTLPLPERRQSSEAAEMLRTAVGLLSSPSATGGVLWTDAR